MVVILVLAGYRLQMSHFKEGFLSPGGTLRSLVAREEGKSIHCISRSPILALIVKLSSC